MADLPSDSILRNVNGDYDFSVIPGVRYMFALKGTFDGATVTMSILDGPFSALVPGTEVFVPVLDGSFTDSTEHEMIPTGGRVRLTLADSTADTIVSVSWIMMP